MRFLAFYKAITDVFSRENEAELGLFLIPSNHFFIESWHRLAESPGENELLQMTRATILLEGFCRYLSDSRLKRSLLDVRASRWSAHFGTPTVTFLLSYKNNFDRVQRLFECLSSTRPDEPAPWLVGESCDFVEDLENNVLSDPKSISRVEVPPTREVMGIFTKTHNPFGGFTTAPCDPVSRKFIEYAATVVEHGGKMLEIGAAFGAATLEALAKGSIVFCNDIDPENLAVVRSRSIESLPDSADSITGDSSRLVLIPGRFPEELVGLPEHFFDAILLCRVLHFFSGKKIEESLALLSNLLAPGGKIYIVCETPYLKNWQRFLPEFNRRVSDGNEWPGEVTDPAEYESSGRAASLPKFVHWITKEVLERSLLRTKFSVEYSEYIDRKGQFPDDLLLSGCESVGVIGLSAKEKK